MALVRQWNKEDPAAIAMRAERDRYGSELAYARRTQLWLIADHFKVEYPKDATKEIMIQILVGANITAQQAFPLLEGLEKARAERFLNIQSQAEKQIFGDQPRKPIADMKIYELKSELKRRGGKPTPKMKKLDVLQALEDLNGQDTSERRQ